MARDGVSLVPRVGEDDGRVENLTMTATRPPGIRCSIMLIASAAGITRHVLHALPAITGEPFA